MEINISLRSQIQDFQSNDLPKSEKGEADKVFHTKTKIKMDRLMKQENQWIYLR